MITAKELAEKLGISQTAVSMALHDKPGVSQKTRQQVIAAAEQYGYDFNRLSAKDNSFRNICFISYRVHNAVMYYSGIEAALIDGMEQECRELGYRLQIMNVSRDDPTLKERMEDLRLQKCAGIIVLATEMQKEDVPLFLQYKYPMILVDNYFASKYCIGVSIDNVQGAYMATECLLRHHDSIPGYLASSYPIGNFRQRRIGFENAVRDYGKSVSGSIRHALAPSIEGARAEMLSILDSGHPHARAYFAENDFLAIGALQAFQEKGYRVPEDVAVIGFDDIPEDTICDPPLSSVHVPFHFIGKMAVRSFHQLLMHHDPYKYKTTVIPYLVKRGSV